MKYQIDSSETIIVNGNKYYIRIRTRNAENPVVLFLHGGCGSPDRAHVMKFQSPLARALAAMGRIREMERGIRKAV